MGLFDGVTGVIGGARSDDDIADRLNHRYTVVILLIFAFIVVDQQFIHGARIVCWVPAHFSDYQEAYAQEYCWVRNTYYLPFRENIPREEEAEKRQMIPYYQWVPAILCLQALLFQLPCTLWRTLNGRSGLNLPDFIEKSQALAIMDQIGADALHGKTLNHLAQLMGRFSKSETSDKKMACTLSIKHIVSRTCLLPFGRGRGRFLVALYMFCKFLYIVNSIGQLFLLDKLLGMDFHSYGFTILDDYFNDRDLTASLAFPRITMCDFKVRRLGNIQRYTVQCVLPINLFNEKFFTVIYVWMLIVTAFSVYSFIRWFIVLTPMGQRKSYIARNIIHALQSHEVMQQGMLAHHVDVDDQKENLRVFVEKYLKQDGIFALRLTGRNVDPVAEADLIFEIWKNFRAGIGDPILTDDDTASTIEVSPDGSPQVNNRAGIYPRLSQMSINQPNN